MLQSIYSIKWTVDDNFSFCVDFPPYALAYAHVHAKTALMCLSTKIILTVSDSHKCKSQVNAQRSNGNISTVLR